MVANIFACVATEKLELRPVFQGPGRESASSNPVMLYPEVEDFGVWVLSRPSRGQANAIATNIYRFFFKVTHETRLSRFPRRSLC
jgi:hypothetical protein